MRTQFVESQDGTRVAYDVTGSGPALMLLHGAGKTRMDWHKIGYVERLSNDFTVITIDIRGTGESSFLIEIGDYTIEKIYADLNTVADACALKQFSVWCFSFGGNIARYLGAWSERVTAIAVIGVPFGPAVDAAFDRYIDEFVEKYGPLAQESVGDLTGKKRESALKQGIPVWIACFQAMRQWPSINPGDISCPTLLMVGTKNENVMNWVGSNQGELKRTGVIVEVIEGLNHMQEFSQINQVYPVVKPFLKDQIDRASKRGLDS